MDDGTQKPEGVFSMEEERFDFENLIVYRRSLEFVDFIYEITKRFPKTELFSLIDQLRRAAISICLNIAEGSGGSKVEFSRFLRIARRSVRECVAVTEIAHRRKFINTSERKQSRGFCLELSKMINGLMRSLKKTSGPELQTPNARASKKTPNSELRTPNSSE